MVQDSKHGAKTARNQLFTGARLLALGNDPLYYELIRELAEHEDAPLYWRDVENIDRQDDRAAARLFAWETLQHHCAQFPDRSAVALYLFFLGGLFDAWQSRKMTHSERIALALRCRFFLKAWQAHIDAHPDHTRHRNFISRESMDIFITMCDSLIALVGVYREYYPTWPFLPWLHSTEPVEHVFGVLRQLKLDFNYADFLYFIPRLCAYLLGVFGLVDSETRANATAAGYWHTYALAKGIDLRTLVSWPSDKEIAALSDAAFADVIHILKVIGIDAEAIL
ncbi:hypothetical protein EXIGLDRAFT_634508, partial [Exidia glandulosa HHB12029]